MAVTWQFVLENDNVIGQFILTSDQGFTLPRAITSDGKAFVIIRAGTSDGVLELYAYSGKFEPAALRFKVKGVSQS